MTATVIPFPGPRPRVVVKWTIALDRPGSPYAFVVTQEGDVAGVEWSCDSREEAIASAKKHAFWHGFIFRDLTEQRA